MKVFEVTKELLKRRRIMKSDNKGNVEYSFLWRFNRKLEEGFELLQGS